MLRLGIAGCGWAGERHREAAAAVERIEVTAIADVDAETRSEWSVEWGVDAYEGYGALLAEADLDAVAEAGVRLVVAESARYEAWTQAVEDRLAEGAIGGPVFARYNWLHGFGGYGYDRTDWLNDPERLGGGSWLLNGVHLVSPLRGWFRGGGADDVDRVFAREYHTPRSTLPTASRATSVPRWRSAA